MATRPVNALANPGATKLNTFTALDDEKRMEKREKREKKLEAQRLEQEKIAREKRDAAMAKMVGQSWADLSDDEDDFHVVGGQPPVSKAVDTSSEESSDSDESDREGPAPPVAPVKEEKKPLPVKITTEKPKDKKAKKISVDEDDIDAILKDMQIAASEAETTPETSSIAPQPVPKETASEETVKASEKLRQARTAAAAAGTEEKSKDAKKSNAEKKKEKKEKKMLFGR